jgi:large repetitive protein
LNDATSATPSFTTPTVTVNTTLIFRLTVTDNDAATASTLAYVTVRNVNQLPVANAGPDQTVNEGDTVTLASGGTDADGTITSYAWAYVSGPSISLAGASSVNPTFIAPQVTANGVVTLRLTVRDNNGGTATDTVDITVRHVNKLPVPLAGADKSANEGTTVTHSGSATDADGTIVSYAWTQTAGPTVTLTGANTKTFSFAVPEVIANTVFTFQLTVTDSEGGTASDAIDITILNVNKKPTANAGPDQLVLKGQLVQLNGSGTDLDGTIAAYLWEQTAGPSANLSDATTAAPTFTAPTVTANTVLSFKLTVTDNGGATATDTVAVTVRP